MRFSVMAHKAWTFLGDDVRAMTSGPRFHEQRSTVPSHGRAFAAPVVFVRDLPTVRRSTLTRIGRYAMGKEMFAAVASDERMSIAQRRWEHSNSA